MDNRMHHRRQFILSSETLDEFKNMGWTNLPVTDRIFLSAHPDLQLSVSESNGVKLFLLGYLLDPFYPEKSNQEILDLLAAESKDFNNLIKNVEKYSGRWALLYKDSTSLNLMHDTFGQRSIFYYFKNNTIVCASDTSLINTVVDLKHDNSPELKAFFNSERYLKAEGAWIGDGTVYADVKRLLPNHYLDLTDKKKIRFWPNQKLEKLDLEEGVELCSAILKGSLIAANNRIRLAQAVTSGWDSRLLLAASKPVTDRIKYFISYPDDTFKVKDDYKIPKRISSEIGVPIYLQKCDTPIPEEFKKVYIANCTMAQYYIHPIKLKYIYQYYKEFQDYMLVSGLYLETYRIPPQHRPTLSRGFTPEKITNDFWRYTNVKYVEQQMEAWLKEVSSYSSETGIDIEKDHMGIYDLLHMEQKLGNWGASYFAEQDIACEVFTPANNRLLAKYMLSTDIKNRIFPNYILFKKLMAQSWPELLTVPFGPTGLKLKFRALIKHLIVKYNNGY